jgi:biopolymer transport protein ExbD
MNRSRPPNPTPIAPSVQIAPLVDVILVVMLLFMVLAAGQQHERGLSIRLPRLDGVALKMPLEIRIDLASEGSIAINDEPFQESSGAWRAILERSQGVARSQSAPMLVTLALESGVPYYRLIGVLNELAALSIRDVTISVTDSAT